MMVGGTGSIALLNGGLSYVYNNTVYRSGSFDGNLAPSCIFLGYRGTFEKGTLIANNLCVNAVTNRSGRVLYIDSTNGLDVSAVTILNNLYYNPHGHDGWRWLNVEYSSLAAFQAASGQTLIRLPLIHPCPIPVKVEFAPAHCDRRRDRSHVPWGTA